MLRYRMLGKSGLRVSELCLGTMSFGSQWGFGADEAESHAVLDAFRGAGGNFLDTANKYHGGETEEIVGRWLAPHRHETVVATKYTLSMNPADPNAAGNHRKNLHVAVEESLRRLRTDYIDLLWVHAWDDWTPFEETMRALDDLVRAGKVLYLGVSDTPAWVVSASNVLAELRGWTRYVGLQIEYSLLERTVERDLLPMAEHFELSVLAWAPLGGGVLTGKYTRPGADPDSLRRAGNESRGRTGERALLIARTVDEVADELGATSAQVATAWVASRSYLCIPRRRSAQGSADRRHAPGVGGSAGRRAAPPARRGERRRARLPRRIPADPHDRRHRQGRAPLADRRAPGAAVSRVSGRARSAARPADARAPARARLTHARRRAPG